MKTSLIIPCYNESDGIPQLAERLRSLLPSLSEEADPEIIFVDDGSVDDTAGTIRRHCEGMPYSIVSHDRNRGLGAALRTGFAASRGDEVVTLDSDCTYDPMHVPDLLARVRSGADVVTGSPYHPDGEVVNVVPWRLLVSKTLSRLYWIVLPARLYTYTSCFRAYRRDALTRLTSSSDDFLAVTELLVSAIFQRMNIAEVPERLTSRRFGVSKIRVLKVAILHVKFLFRVFVWRIAGYPHHTTPNEDHFHARSFQPARTDNVDPAEHPAVGSSGRERWLHASSE